MTDEEQKGDLLLWIDFETTGLDPTNDRIIEVGAILTDSELTELSRFHAFMQRTRATVAAFNRAPQVVKEMHDKSGLLTDWFSERRTLIAETDNGRTFDGNEKRLTEARLDEVLVAWVQMTKMGYNEDPSPNPSLDRVVLAGAGVSHMEDKWIETWLPKLNGVLHYRALDISVIKSGLETLLGFGYPELSRALRDGLMQKSEIQHRALADVEDAIKDAKRLVVNFAETI